MDHKQVRSSHVSETENNESAQEDIAAESRQEQKSWFLLV